MWHETSLSDVLDIKYPIVQAPMAGGFTTPELISTVCEFGALGSLGAGYMTPDVIDATISITKSLSAKPFNVNLFIQNNVDIDSQKIEKMQSILKPIADELNISLPIIKKPFLPPFEKQVEVLFAHNISIFSFTFGALDPYWVKTFKEKKIFLIGTATTDREAKHLQEIGVDSICLQGKEAGGHRGTFLSNVEDALVPTFSLLESVASKIKLPLIASGGLMNGEDILKALSLGASGVQMGTAFLSLKEAGTKPQHKKALLDQEHDATILTKAFSGKHARALPNNFTCKMQEFESDILEYPLQNILTKPIRDISSQKNIQKYMSLWAGQRAFLCQDLSCSSLLTQLIHECEK